MNIKSYVLSDNGNNLFGTNNDARLIYNLFYRFYLKNKNLWNVPELFLNNVVKNIKYASIIIIYFSGHSKKNGDIIILNNSYSIDYFLNLINLNKKYCNVIFIIDTCYGDKFITKKKYKFIDRVEYFISMSDSNKSKEFLIDYNKDDYKYTNNKTTTKIVNGIFTYYFYKVLSSKKYDVNNWFKIKNSNIWKYVKIQFNQELFYFSNTN